MRLYISKIIVWSGSGLDDGSDTDTEEVTIKDWTRLTINEVCICIAETNFVRIRKLTIHDSDELDYIVEYGIYKGELWKARDVKYYTFSSNSLELFYEEAKYRNANASDRVTTLKQYDIIGAFPNIEIHVVDICDADSPTIYRECGMQVRS